MAAWACRLQSQGFRDRRRTAGIVVQAPQFEGVENIVFPSFVMGVPITNVSVEQHAVSQRTISKVVGAHTLKFGGQFHNDQVNENPNATFNGTFNIDGTETGSPFADFLLGFPSNFTQTTGQRFYLRNQYEGALLWKIAGARRSNLTVNLGVRWDLIEPWSEKYNNIQTIVPGEQSVLYPNALPGLLVPGDPGIPRRSSPTQYHNFAPRIGLAYSPKPQGGFLKFLFGDGGKTSIRASYGMFYTAFPGLTAGIMYGVPPFGYNYLSPAPPLFRYAVHQLGGRRAEYRSVSVEFSSAQCFRKRTRTRLQFRGGHSDQRRSLLLLPQQRALHRELHVLDSAPDHARTPC